MTSESHSLHFRTERICFFGAARLRAVCNQLIDLSQWFSIMPLPNDEWELEVRVENAERVRSWTQANT